MTAIPETNDRNAGADSILLTGCAGFIGWETGKKLLANKGWVKDTKLSEPNRGIG